MEDYDLLIINSNINSDVINEVLNIDETKISDRLIIVLNTYGGSPYVAYRAMTHLQHMYSGKQIHIVVPDLAMSAGTLMCLGGDKIYMHEGSCLGPLDLQVEHPSDGETISSLDIQQSCYRILALTEVVADAFFKETKNKFQLSKLEASKLSYDAAVKLFTPLMDKIDPYHLQEGYRAGPISEHFARLLMTRGVRGSEKRANIANKLTNFYQTHGYPITKDEVEFLGLTVEKIKSLNVYNDVIQRYNSSGNGVNYQLVRPPKKPNNSGKLSNVSQKK